MKTTIANFDTNTNIHWEEMLEHIQQHQRNLVVIITPAGHIVIMAELNAGTFN